MEAESEPASDTTPELLLTGRDAVIDAWRRALLAAADAGAREITGIDAHFADWPLDEPAVLDALVRWARAPGRRLRLIGLDFAITERRHPRFTAWRRDWAHRFEALQPSEPQRAELPALWCFGAESLRVLDRERWRARRVLDAALRRQHAEEAEAIAQRCEASWPATTLGL